MKNCLSHLDPGSLAGRTVLVRADLNVPLAGGRVADDQRVQASVPTLEYLHRAGARVVVLSHLGRPKGRPDPAYSLRPVAEVLSVALGMPVRFVPETVGPACAEAVAQMEAGEVTLLENTRFHPGETANDPELAWAWAELGDDFVNDAFGTAHRAHASNVGLAEAIRARGGRAVAGLLLERELRYLGEALASPERPFVAILGGAKISGKIDVIEALLPRVDRLVVGGAMANTFFRAQGRETGASLVEPDRVDVARALLEEAGSRLALPVDCVVAERVEEGAPWRVAGLDDVRPGEAIVDIGPETVARIRELLSDARTVVWNGPMGVFEIPEFAKGTIGVAHALAEACDRGALGVVGGGDSAAAARVAGVASRLSHISTGGGASLELLAGRTLPGVAALDERED